MPIYEYQCAACGKVSEILQKFSDPAPAKCELCGSGPVSKLLSRQTGFVLNGTGWYVTDFKGDKGSKANKGGKGPSGESGGGKGS